MLPKDLTQDIKKRLATIKGQVVGLSAMLDNEKDPEKTVTQFKAVTGGLQAAYQLLLDEVYRKALAIKIVEVVDACPGNCGNEEKIKLIKEQFPNYNLDEIAARLKEMNKIEHRVVEFKQKKP